MIGKLWTKDLASCIAGDTIVRFVEGQEMMISEWAQGGKLRYIWAGESWVPARAKFVKKAPTVTLNLSNGSSIRLTADHRVGLWDGGETTSGECDGKSLTWLGHGPDEACSVTASVIESNCEEDVYDFEILGERSDADRWASIAGLRMAPGKLVSNTKTQEAKLPDGETHD